MKVKVVDVLLCIQCQRRYTKPGDAGLESPLSGNESNEGPTEASAPPSGSGRAPILLECGHALCKECVDKLNANHFITCGWCGKQSDTKHDVLHEYLQNLVTSEKGNVEDPQKFIDEIEKFHPDLGEFSEEVQVEDSSELKAPPCSECDEPAEVQCCNCGDNPVFCTSCFEKMHTAFKSLRSHQCEPLQKTGEQMCPNHCGNVAIICENCEVLTCDECIAKGLHQGHKIRSTEEQEKVCAEIDECLKKAQKSLAVMKESDKQLRGGITKLQDKSTEHWNQFESSLIGFYGSMQIYREKMRTQLLDSTQEQMNRMKRMHDDLRASSEIVKKIISQMTVKQMKPKIQYSERRDIQQHLGVLNGIRSTIVEDQSAVFVKIPQTTEKIKRHFDRCDGFQLTSAQFMTLNPFSSTPGSQELMEAIAASPESVETSSLESAAKFRSSREFAPNTTRGFVPPPQTPPVGGSHRVIVTHVNNPKDFYVQLLQNNEELERLSRNIQRYCKTHAREEMQLEVGGVYLARYDSDMQFYRARVKHFIEPAAKNKDRMVQVLYVDYGNESDVSEKNITKIPKQFTKLPEMALHCSLRRVVPREAAWRMQDIKVFEDIVKTGVMEMWVKSITGNSLEVDLLTMCSRDVQYDSPSSIAESLVWLEVARFHCNKKPQPPPAYMRREPKYHSVELPMIGTRCDVNVVHVNSPDSFYVHNLSDEQPFLEQLMTDLQKHYNDERNNAGLPIILPKKEMMCVALFSVDERWYRAVIEDIPGQRLVKVRYVDYGNTEIVPWTSIRKILHNFTRFPVKAIHCQLCDVEPVDELWDPKALDPLMQCFDSDKNVEMITISLGYTNKASVVLIHNSRDRAVCINSKLVEEGWARSIGVRSLPQHLDEIPVKLEKTGRVRSGRHSLSSDDHEDTSGISRPFSLSNVKESSPEKNRLVPVKVIQLRNPTHFYIHINTKEEKKGLQSLLLELNKIYNKRTEEPPLDASLDKTKVYVAYIADDKQWYRVNVDGVKDDGIAKVSLVDFPRSSDVPLRNIQSLETVPSLHIHGRYMWMCRLHGVKPSGASFPAKWSLTTSERMRDLVNDHTLQMQEVAYCKNRFKLVDLYVSQEYDDPLGPTTFVYYSIADILIEQGLALVKQKSNVCSEASSVKVSPKETELAGQATKAAEEEKEEEMTTWHPARPPTAQSFRCVPTDVDEDFFIYLQDEEQRKLCEQMKSEIRNVFSHSSISTCKKKWKKGEPCYALFHLDNNWYRAVVLEMVDKENVRVMFADHGTINIVSLGELQTSLLHHTIPLQRYKCKLHNVRPAKLEEKWDLVVLDEVHPEIVEKWCTVTVHNLEEYKPGDDLSISLRLFNGSDLGDYLVEREWASYINENDPSIEKTGGISPYPSRLYPSIGSKIPVSFGGCFFRKPTTVYLRPLIEDITDTTDEFFQELIETKDSFASMVAMLEFAEDWGPLKRARPGEPCVAKFLSNNKSEEGWYRAFIKSVGQEGVVTVEFVDFGDEQDVPVSCLKESVKDLIDIPHYVMEYVLDGVTPQEEEWTHSNFSRLQRTLAECKKLVAVIKDITENGVVKIDLMETKEDGRLELAVESLIQERVLAMRKHVDE